jgi:hypothetical protein
MEATTATSRSASRAPVILTLSAAACITAFHLVYGWMGHSIYRDHHLGAALAYARDGVDLLRPVIVGFNANNAPTPQELPVWQAAASLPMRWFGNWFGWANTTSLLLFFSALYPAWKVGKRLGGSAAGWWTTALLLLQPLVWINAGMAGTDGTCIAATIWFFYCGLRLLDGRNSMRWISATAATGALAATLKLPFMMAAGFALGIILLVRHRKDVRAWLGLIVAALVSIGAFMIWTNHTDSCLAQAEFPFVDLRVSHNPEMLWWYFGDWSYRLNPFNWIKGGWRALNGIFGSFVLLAFPVAVFGLRRSNLEAVALLCGAVLTTLIFSHLVLHHQQYFLMYSLPIALLIAPVGAEAWVRLSAKWRWPQAALEALLVGVALLGVLQGLVGLEAIHQDPYPSSVVERLRKHTSPEDKLLIVEGGWGGDYLFLSDRRGLSIWNAGFLNEDDNLRKLRQLGYNKLVLISESPLATALQMTNPGGAGYRRRTYKDAMTPEAEAWPTVHADADILIKHLPSPQ